MFSVAVSKELYDHCQNLVQNIDFGQRHTANGNQEQQLTGIIGQSVVMNLFGLGNVTGEEGFDDGVDLVFNNKSIDIKTMGRTTNVRPNYTNNFLGLQDYFNTDIYIFCSYNKLTFQLTVCGWIANAEFKDRRRFYPKGSTRTRTDGSTFKTFADLYEIDIRDLNNVNSIDDLKTQLNTLG